MDSIRTYLLTVVCVAMISSIAINMISKKSPHAAIIKLIAGLIMSITIISPWLKIDFENLSLYLSDFETEAQNAVVDGTEYASTTLSTIIKDNAEAYILDKANQLGLSIEVEVCLSDESPPMPTFAEIHGTVSPYAKARLQEIIENDLAISKENQLWK